MEVIEHWFFRMPPVTCQENTSCVTDYGACAVTDVGLNSGSLLGSTAHTPDPGTAVSTYRRLKKYEHRLLTVSQAGWPERSIAKVTVAQRINNRDARDTI
jgi:hypothetical protein